VKGVQQPLHQIVHSTKFIADDEQVIEPMSDEAEEEEWTGFGESEDVLDDVDEEEQEGEESLTWEDIMGGEGTEEMKGEGDEELDQEVDDAFDEVFGSDEDDEDDIELVLEEEPAQAKPKSEVAKLSKAKRGLRTHMMMVFLS